MSSYSYSSVNSDVYFNNSSQCLQLNSSRTIEDSLRELEYFLNANNLDVDMQIGMDRNGNGNGNSNNNSNRNVCNAIYENENLNESSIDYKNRDFYDGSYHSNYKYSNQYSVNGQNQHDQKLYLQQQQLQQQQPYYLETFNNQIPRALQQMDYGCSSFTHQGNALGLLDLNVPKSMAIIPKWVNVPEGSKFFVIKSSNIEHIQKSYYNRIWSSTYFGNKRLSDAYNSLEKDTKIFLLFSVTKSGRFCGVAEMISNLQENLDTTIWSDEEKKFGQAFKVRWLFVRDVHNRDLKHFLIPSNDMKPITNSRDTQEIPFSIGNSIIKLFKDKSKNSDLKCFLDDVYD